MVWLEKKKDFKQLPKKKFFQQLLPFYNNLTIKKKHQLRKEIICYYTVL